VARVAYLLLGDPDQAQDAAQEAFLIGWRDLQRLRDPARFRPWVTGIAVNLCRRRHRASARARQALDRHSGDGAMPADEGDTAAVRLAVRAAVNALPRRMREAVVLRFYCGFGEAEIAEVLGIATGTVKSRLGRARGRLAETLRTVVEVE
jgi:RNA polymerase sigma factor (sigma-70 family)